MKKYILILMIVFLVSLITVNLISSQEGNYMYKYRKNATLDIPVYANDNSPATAAKCAITITDPNGIIIRSNVSMEMNKNHAIYNLTVSDVATLGLYGADIYCSSTGNSGFSSLTYEVTNTGTTFTTAQGLLYIVFVIAAIAIFLLTFYGAIKLPFKNIRDEEGLVVSMNDLKYVKIFLMVLCYLLLILITGLLRSITANYLFETGIDKFFDYAFWILFSGLMPIFICSMIFAFIIFLQDKKISGALERGLPFR